jgi:pyruvate kinase
MLNKGPNVGEAITALRGLMQRMMEHQSKKTSLLRPLHSW